MIRRPVVSFSTVIGRYDVLYKYVTHQRALTCIPEVGDGSLRATQPAALNDPFECAVAPIYAIPDKWKRTAS